MPSQSIALSASDKTAIHSSQIEVYAPDASSEDLLRWVEDHLVRGQPVVAEEHLRRSAFFDEVIPLVLVVRTPCRPEILDQVMNATDIAVSALVHDALDHDEDATRKHPPKLALDNDRFSARLVGALKVVSLDTQQLCIWPCTMYLRDPARKYQHPVVQFAVSAQYIPPAPGANSTADDGDHYLPSGTTLPSNLLAQLTTTPAFAGKDIRLPSDRIEKLVPRSSVLSSEFRPFRAYTPLLPMDKVIDLRTQCTVLPSASLVSVYIDIPKSSSTTTSLNRVNAVCDGTELPRVGPPSLPDLASPGDRHTSIFQLEMAAPVQIKIAACAHISESTKAVLLVQTDVDVQYPHLNEDCRLLWSPLDAKADSLTDSEAAEQSISISITLPPSVLVGVPFPVEVFVVNRGSRPRHLVVRPLDSAMSDRAPFKQTSTKNSETAAAVLDDSTLIRILSANNRGNMLAETIALEPQTRIGVLAAGACHDARLMFMCLSPGLVVLDGLVVIDVGTVETVTISNLPQSEAVL